MAYQARSRKKWLTESQQRQQLLVFRFFQTLLTSCKDFAIKYR